MPGIALVLTVFSGWVWAAHALWPLLPAGSYAHLPPRRASRWALAFAATAALAQSAAWMGNTDRLLVLGGALSSPGARFALVASLGMVVADLAQAWSVTASGAAPDGTGGTPNRGSAALQALLGAAALLGFFWALENARVWRPVGREALLPALSLCLATLPLVRPSGRAQWLAGLAPFGGAAWVAQLPEDLRQRLLGTMAVAPLLGGLLLIAAEPMLPKRPAWLARGVGVLLFLTVQAMVFVSTIPNP